MLKTCVIFNPAARGEKATRFQSELGKVSSHCACKPTVAAGSARALAREAVLEGFDTIVAAGGDGTVNEVLNGIGDAPDGFERARLGVLPFGTVNVFARELRIPSTFSGAWETLQKGAEILIDLPRAEFSLDGKPQIRYFAQMAGAGWDGRTVELVEWELKKRVGKYAYFVAGIKAWLGTLPMVTARNGERSLEGPLVLIGNGRRYGGDWTLFPMADLQDGLLEVTVFPSLSCVGVFRSMVGLLTNRLYSLGGVKHFRATTLELSSPSAVWMHLDGENVARLPVRFSIRPKALRVICGAGAVTSVAATPRGLS